MEYVGTLHLFHLMEVLEADMKQSVEISKEIDQSIILRDIL